jgi:hypothetical protein
MRQIRSLSVLTFFLKFSDNLVFVYEWRDIVSVLRLLKKARKWQELGKPTGYTLLGLQLWIVPPTGSLTRI